MGSKYDIYWQRKYDDLVQIIDAAISGRPAELDCSDIRSLGSRASWYGNGSVQDRRALESSMAHITSLVNMATRLGLCSKSELIFTFIMDTRCRLELKTAPRSDFTDSASARVGCGQHSIPQNTSIRTVDKSPGVSLDATAACGEIHRLLAALPLFRSPDAVPFRDGLYFFYEEGETSAHAAAGRVVRIGNHPRLVGGLVRRLKDHYRSGPNAKNGSVFRRYLGGALLRRDHPASECLQPGPGLGHWEKQHQHECFRCSSYEEKVSDVLSRAFGFRCVRIDDRTERERFEKLLVGTVAACKVCCPSPSWLGRFAYNDNVRVSGLWNSDYIGGPVIGPEDLDRFRALVGSSRPTTNAERLEETLLLIPCSGDKHGSAVPPLPVRSVTDFLDPVAAQLLSEGRELAFKRRRTFLDVDSPFLPALAYYTGQPYAIDGLKELLVNFLQRGLHCLIVSGGYGLLRPEELIHKYGAHISATRAVWKHRLPTALRDYVLRNGIRRTFGCYSSEYAKLVPKDLAEEDWSCVPTFDRERDSGSPIRAVPRKVGSAIKSLFENDFNPNGQCWVKRDPRPQGYVQPGG